jgi:hypothetical protein
MFLWFKMNPAQGQFISQRRFVDGFEKTRAQNAMHFHTAPAVGAGVAAPTMA